MEAVTSRVQRTLVSPGGLTLLAQACGVSLPVDWVAAPSEQDAGLLAAQQLVDAQGRPTRKVEDGFAPWRAPLLSVTLELAPVAAPATGSQQAQAFSAHLTLSQDRALGVLRRPDLPLVELSFGDVAGVGVQAHRLLLTLGEAAQGAAFEVSHLAFDALSRQARLHDVAKAFDDRLGSLVEAADLLRRTTRTLTVLVARPAGPFGLRVWYDADGWWEVAPVEGGEGRTLRACPGVPAVAALMPLVAGALG